MRDDVQCEARQEGFEALVDEFLATYVFWRESCEAVSAAYDDWLNCEPERRGHAFEDYRAALNWGSSRRRPTPAGQRASAL